MNKNLTVNVEKRGKEYVVVFWIENQGFELKYGGTKAEALWMKKMLLVAFKNYERLVLEKIK